MNPNTDKPEAITEEQTLSVPYSKHHYYQYESQFCAVFGCGVELSIQERLAGLVCNRHSGAFIIEKVSPAMLMRLLEVTKYTDWEIENLRDGYIESESQPR